ncbi:hypothetical protein, partial [Chryseobacterium luteum]|uniref:hypothetical protein n=1 Tax=Chryseobacterium luteum TaxID=421531 RepID=UPI000553787E
LSQQDIGSTVHYCSSSSVPESGCRILYILVRQLSLPFCFLSGLSLYVCCCRGCHIFQAGFCIPEDNLLVHHFGCKGLKQRRSFYRSLDQLVFRPTGVQECREKVAAARKASRKIEFFFMHFVF